MKNKKAKGANLEKRRFLFLQLGLIVASSISLAAIEWRSTDFKPLASNGDGYDAENVEFAYDIDLEEPEPEPDPEPVPEQPDNHQYSNSNHAYYAKHQAMHSNRRTPYGYSSSYGHAGGSRRRSYTMSLGGRLSWLSCVVISIGWHNSMVVINNFFLNFVIGCLS